jgi:hypothetical protein
MSGMPDTTDNGYVLPRRMEGPLHAPYPGYVQTEEQRRRWDMCAHMVTELSAHYEGGRADARFVWVGTRALYNSEIPTSERTPESDAALAEFRKTFPARPQGPADSAMRTAD